VVTALVVIRISTQFLAQTLGVMVLRWREPDLPRPFRMWLYPIPAVLAFLGFIYVIVMRPKSLESIRLALLVIAVGTALFVIRRRWNRSSLITHREYIIVASLNRRIVESSTRRIRAVQGFDDPRMRDS